MGLVGQGRETFDALSTLLIMIETIGLAMHLL